MKNLLYALAVVLVIVWAIAFLGYDAGNMIHILLFIAIVAVFLRMMKGQKML